MKKGFTLIELLIVIAIIAILAAIAVPNFLEAQTRAKVSRVKADQRSLATGLESYYVDNNSYPAWASITGNFSGTRQQPEWPGSMGHANGFSGEGTGAASIHSFRVRVSTTNADLFFMLTTPISYMTNFLADPFSDTKNCSYGYYAQKSGWILISFGPDVDEAPNDQGYSGDIDPYVETLYSYHRAQPDLFLVTGAMNDANDSGAFTYDPTNGTSSEGDVYRVKQ